MPKQHMQKAKLIALQKILLEKTDEDNGLTMAEIIEALKAYGINSERKSLYNDFQILEAFGLDICRTKTSTVRYYIGSRSFELAELKLLVDAIQSSKFITPNKSLVLIKKLEGLVSENKGKELQREVYFTNKAKALNEKIYYNVDTIHNAISKNVKIIFRYYQWDVNFGNRQRIIRKERHNSPYIISPWALRWDDENYYLIGFDSNAEKIKHYRVDKMDSISLSVEERDGREAFNQLDITQYPSGVFSMFGGEKTSVTLSVNNSLVGVIADRFGSDVFITKETENTFRVSVKITLSNQFYAWLFGLGKQIKLIDPPSAVEEFSKLLKDVSDSYR